MGLGHHLVLFFVGLIGSFFSGMLGIGGAVINYPLLLYVPDWLGVGHFTAKEVSSISMFQVFFASLSGLLAYRMQRKHEPSYIHKGIVLIMGSSILVGSLIGGAGSKYMPSESINLIYGIVAVVAVILMLIPNRGKREDLHTEQLVYHKSVAALSAGLVGLVSGTVGAGGAFILIPIMLTVLKIPTRITITSSLAIVFISAVGGVTGKLAAGHIPFWATFYTVLGSVSGAPLGSFVGSKVNGKYLRITLAVFITATAVKVWFDILK
ncbi:sulfite exporter TauE/SafE family protein [Brevibacillus massiliensis]|uniref:sulfite exporter TauE/SafE family protein n=1 Tax=Brevibacillus massiliensis TaxID=1118054 RepID=UPI0002F417E6|nr:sulfite exporter TauE/SafE family protein [Brevibacillus massiliensis]